MKKIFTLAITATISIFSFKAIAQGVAVNTSGTKADTSAMLDVSSTTKGVLIPRMTKAQRNAIITPANGLLIYQTDSTPSFYYYDGSQWTTLKGAAGAQGASGQGVPAGGTTGQVLTKLDNSDYNSVWATPSNNSSAALYGTLKDANGVTLGTVLTSGAPSFTVLIKSPNGYFYTISLDGTFTLSQIYYSNTGCNATGGSVWLNAGGTAGNRSAKILVYEGMTGNFYVAANPASNGFASTVSISTGSLFNTGGAGCSNVNTNTTGYLLTPISRATAGIPATITPPLSIVF